MIAIINDINAIQELYTYVNTKLKQKTWDKVIVNIYNNVTDNSYYAHCIRRELK